jgi:hypothetical protein
MIRELSEDYSCSTAWAGFVLGTVSPAARPTALVGGDLVEEVEVDVSDIALASAAMRGDGAYWQLPLTLAGSVDSAKKLATDAHAPLTAVALPKPSSSSFTSSGSGSGSGGSGWAQAVLQQQSSLAALGRDGSLQLTPVRKTIIVFLTPERRSCLMMENDRLPRQARDKHRENTPKT